MDRPWQPRQKSRMASILETVSMIAEFRHQQWSYTNFWLSGRTLGSRDRIFEFSQELVKICAAAKNLDTRVNFDMSGWYNQPVQYGPLIKAERPELGSHLGSTCPRGSTSTRIWTRALQPDQEEISSWRYRRAHIVSGRKTFPPIFLLGAEILTPAKVLSYAFIFTRRLYFVYPPRFSWDVNNLSIRQYFHETPRF